MTHKQKRITQLPLNAQRVIDRYRNLKLGQHTINTPYFMNRKGKKGHRVMLGKGTPEEIEHQVAQLAEAHKFDLTLASADEIKDFMITHEIGIDCSGFVVWVLNELVVAWHGKPVWNFIDFRLPFIKSKVVQKLRPVENISVRVLTHEVNSKVVHSVSEVQVGDVIRTLNGGHVLIISEIEYDEANTPVQIKYINSTEYNNTPHGLRTGTIKVVDPMSGILDQLWIDEETDVNWTYEATKEFRSDTRIMRLKALA